MITHQKEKPMNINQLDTFCADVGSTNSNNFGWTRLRRNGNSHIAQTGTDIDHFIDSIQTCLTNNRLVAIGFESPLFIPAPDEAENLSSGRENENTRSCFAPSGGYVALLGLHQMTYVLNELSDELQNRELTLDTSQWLEHPEHSVLLWEAFVSGDSHTDSDEHEDDAITAALAFLDAVENHEVDVRCEDEDVFVERPVLSLAGAAVLRAGLSGNTNLLKEDSVVIKPDDPFQKTDKTIQKTEYDSNKT